MIGMRNTELNLLIEINKELKDPRLESMIQRWMAGREANRKYAREKVRKERLKDKTYARGRNVK